jgi:hypothetical protein
MDKWEELGKKPCAVLLVRVACLSVVKVNKFSNPVVSRKEVSDWNLMLVPENIQKHFKLDTITYKQHFVFKTA